VKREKRRKWVGKVVVGVGKRKRYLGKVLNNVVRIKSEEKDIRIGKIGIRKEKSSVVIGKHGVGIVIKLLKKGEVVLWMVQRVLWRYKVNTSVYT